MSQRSAAARTVRVLAAALLVSGLTAGIVAAEAGNAPASGTQAVGCCMK